ncbi:MAG: creatininase family protein [Oligoflexia bacterium]|nr:creatininase family protein [Oligoflexia bacterium]
MPLEFAAISAEQLRSLSRARTVFFFPVGPLEDHGPHLPLGMDLHEARRLCELAAERVEKELPGWAAVLMPAAPLGLQGNTTKLVLSVRPHVLRDWLVDACGSLMRQGFLHFACFSGHLGPRQLTAIEDAGKIIRRKAGLRRFSRSGQLLPSLVSASSALTTLNDLRTPFWPDPEEHGGARDTSVAQALGLLVIPELPPDQPRNPSWLGRGLNRWMRSASGYWGKPSLATPEQGEVALKSTLERVFPKLRAVWEGSNPNHFFRSWYSLLPPNKSFARGWMLGLLLFLMLVLWAYLLLGWR